MSDRQPRVFGYCRASTKKQVDSPDIQKASIRRYAQFNNLGDVTFYVDAAKSGKVPIGEREAGRELMAAIRPGDHLIIAKIDRAFRRLADCAAILDKLQRMGVSLHVCDLMGGAIDLSAPMGRFMVHILAAFAELERAFISERTKDGLAGKVRKGVAHTRFPGYGFKWEKRQVEGKWVKVRVVDEDERTVMRNIYKWRVEGKYTWEQIRENLAYKLKIKTKEGTDWDTNRIRRAADAEAKLQFKEMRGMG